MERASDIRTAAPAATAPKGQAGVLYHLLEGAGAACELELPSGETWTCGAAPPRFRIKLNVDRPLSGVDELSVGEAYVAGRFEIEGDMLAAMDVRSRLSDGLRLGMVLKFWTSYFSNPLTAGNRKAISSHYSLGDDFYLGFIDRRWRFYSHGIFHSPDETLEQASEHKLETMYRALALEPGMRLLDIGGGWGGVAEYCGGRGVEVTELTIAPDSHRYIENLIASKGLPAQVHLQDFLEHRPEKPYDAVVIYGVIEHIPNYRRFFRRVWDCLKPGGLFYLDASASREKYEVSAFSRRYIWPGTHTFLCLQDLIQEILYHGLDVVEVQNETKDYELTMRHWGERFDARRREITERWGEEIYRAFRLYLWGGCWGFRNDRMQAYHVVAQRRPDPGPRPGLARRVKKFIASLI